MKQKPNLVPAVPGFAVPAGLAAAEQLSPLELAQWAKLVELGRAERAARSRPLPAGWQDRWRAPRQYGEVGRSGGEKTAGDFSPRAHAATVRYVVLRAAGVTWRKALATCGGEWVSILADTRHHQEARDAYIGMAVAQKAIVRGASIDAVSAVLEDARAASVAINILGRVDGDYIDSKYIRNNTTTEQSTGGGGITINLISPAVTACEKAVTIQPPSGQPSALALPVAVCNADVKG